MISNDDESVNMSESEMSVETVERPRKRVKLEELPTFIQKFTSTYFKFTKNKLRSVIACVLESLRASSSSKGGREPVVSKILNCIWNK